MSPSARELARSDTGLASSLRVSLTRLGRRLRTERDDSGHSASAGGVAVLARLSREGELTLGQLAAAERVQPPSMTRAVTCLERDGLVERHAHPSDGRQVVIRLTQPGRDLLAADRRRSEAWLACRLRELSAEDRAALRRAAPILERLSNA